MVVCDQREDTVTYRFRGEPLVIDVIRQLEASTRFPDVSCLIIEESAICTAAACDRFRSAVAGRADSISLN